MLNKSNNKAFNLKTAGKRPPFRLEQHVALGATDKYNDPYKCEIVAHKMRDRYVVSVQITHEPIQTLVYNNSWLFKDMATCWDKFHTIYDIVGDVRNFIEAEGLKNVVFQHMVKHSLSGISADIENIYETSNPTARTVIDESTRGNIIKNFPTIPFRSQNGPDQLDQVYTAAGNAENPIPPDRIMGQLAIPQHIRKELGLKDVVPSPISKFQEAFGLAQGMFKGAASDGDIKTAAGDPRLQFIQKIKEGASKAVAHGQEVAIKYYMKTTGADRAEAEAFYHGVKAVCSQSGTVLNISPSNLLVFMSTDEYRPLFENPELLAKFNHYAKRREQAERAMGCFGLSPIYASITLLPQGDRGYGKCALRLENIAENAVLLSGDSFRLRNPAREDYEPDPMLVLYPFSHLADCKAVSVITAMGQHDLSAGPAQSLLNIMDPQREFGRCEALIFSPLTSSNVTEIVTPSQETSKTIRKALMRIGKAMPVVTATETPEMISRSADIEMPDDPAPKQALQRHFVVRDRVITKRMSSGPQVQGTILDVSNGQITVEWDDKSRSIFDMVEAMMRIQEAPKEAAFGQSGMVVYSLPGMDDKTVLMLSAGGVDPVSLYSLATHNLPAAAAVQGGLENMIESMSKLGLSGSVVRGFVPSSGEEAFTRKEWIEAQLATGARLVVDLDPEQLIIKAGDIDDYIKPHIEPQIEIE